LIFFYHHLDCGGKFGASRGLVVWYYKYHAEQTTFSVDEETIWRLRFKRIEEKVIAKWKTFIDLECRKRREKVLQI